MQTKTIIVVIFSAIILPILWYIIVRVSSYAYFRSKVDAFKHFKESLIKEIRDGE